MGEISLFYAISETGSWWVAAEYAADSVTLDDWESPRSLRREFEEAKGMCEVGVISQGKR